MPNNSAQDDPVVIDTDALQLAALGDGCPQGNIYDGNPLQPTRQGLRSQKELQDAR